MPDSRQFNLAQTLVLGVGLALTLFVLWLAVAAAQAFFQPLPPIATPAAPRTIVIAPSPDVRLDAAAERIDRNTAVLPTLVAAYAIEQTQTASDAMATWAAIRQAGLH